MCIYCYNNLGKINIKQQITKLTNIYKIINSDKERILNDIGHLSDIDMVYNAFNAIEKEIKHE